jgi:hypothetical protein
LSREKRLNKALHGIGVHASLSVSFGFPERGRIVPELQAQGISQYGELIIPPWRLVYRKRILYS